MKIYSSLLQDYNFISKNKSENLEDKYKCNPFIPMKI